MNYINKSIVREMCDEAGFRTTITESGAICMILAADEDYGHDVWVVFEVDEKNNRLRVVAYGGINVKQTKLADAISRVNKYNKETSLMKAYIDNDGDVVIERWEIIDEEVSEDFVLNNVIKLCPPLMWSFFKDYFADFND